MADTPKLVHSVTGLIVEVVLAECDDTHLTIKHRELKTKIPRSWVTTGKWKALN